MDPGQLLHCRAVRLDRHVTQHALIRIRQSGALLAGNARVAILAPKPGPNVLLVAKRDRLRAHADRQLLLNSLISLPHLGGSAAAKKKKAWKKNPEKKKNAEPDGVSQSQSRPPNTLLSSQMLHGFASRSAIMG